MNLYEMTKNEVLEMEYNKLNKQMQEIWNQQLKNPNGWTKTKFERVIAEHKVAIMDAIWTGKIIDDKVLNDYSDIQERFKKEIGENKNIKYKF
ncbi:hypothetical protein DVV91_16920 [Clostridium botulinum]|uniref:FCD domain-containing protein n=1 Tax=Clostridium TaxID=1485 RepID=UPI001966F833|nr:MULTISPECIES: FCD domain-containing protein [Clostridium]MBN1076005.1 hypothetical protein [Clostridium botulinum]